MEATESHAARIELPSLFEESFDCLYAIDSSLRRFLEERPSLSKVDSLFGAKKIHQRGQLAMERSISEIGRQVQTI